MEYYAILFSLDGSYVRDCSGNTIEEVEKAIENLGSRWIFFPFCAIARGNTILVGYQETIILEGMTIQRASEYIKKNAEIVKIPTYKEEIIIK